MKKPTLEGIRGWLGERTLIKLMVVAFLAGVLAIWLGPKAIALVLGLWGGKAAVGRAQRSRNMGRAMKTYREEGEAIRLEVEDLNEEAASRVEEALWDLPPLTEPPADDEERRARLEALGRWDD